MGDTDTELALQELCLWDLAEGCRALHGRLPAIAGSADDEILRAQLDGAAEEADDRAKRLEPLTGREGPDNVWMAGILDDGERDTQSIACGVLLDIALIGAVRKALHAEIASIHTAHAVAIGRGDDRAVGVIERNHADIEDRDASLSETLARLAHGDRRERRFRVSTSVARTT